MTMVLSNCAAHRNDCVVSLLITGPVELCHTVSEGLQESAKERKWRIVIHQCEAVADVIKSKLNVGVDFIVFLFDWRISQTLTNVEANLRLVNQHFIISGAVCLVNCKGILNFVGKTSNKIAQIRNKYNIHFLSANVFKSLICVQLGNRILNLVDAVLGLSCGIPVNGPLT